MDYSTDEMKLDIIRSKLEDAERQAAEEYKELCREKPKEYGEKPFCIRENTYKANFYRYLCEDVLWIISLADSQVQKEWQAEMEKKRQNMYAE